MKKTVMHLRGLILLVCCMLAASLTFAQSNQWGKWCYTDYETTGSHTFTVPQGCTKVVFEAVGGGGAGGFVCSKGSGMTDELHMSYYYQVSAGGGGGAYGRSDTLTDISAGQSFSVYVGKGGSASANIITLKDYINDCTLGSGLFGTAYEHYLLCSAPTAWNNHTAWKKYWRWVYKNNEGFLDFLEQFIPGNSYNNQEDYGVWPFFKNFDDPDGETSYVKRGNTMILEAYGGGTVKGENNLVGAAGGAAAGAGAYHARGGNGGNAVKDCPGIVDQISSSFIKDDMWGRISAGGGGAAGHPGDYTTQSPDHRTEAYCDKEEGFGRGGTGYPPFYGYGGEGTSDWAWDADGHNGSHGDPGQNFGGAGGGSKIGVAGWCKGGDGAGGKVRVWFYIDAPALSVNPTADGANPLHLSEPKNVNLNAGANNLTTGYSTQYQWSPSGSGEYFTENVSSSKTYYVTVTNICSIATNSDACKVTNSGHVQITVDDINAGSIVVDNTTWTCGENPNDTVVTINGSTSPAALATPTGGTYSWQYSTDNSNWTLVPDATGADYTVINTTGYYRRGYAKGTVGPVYTSSVYVLRPSDINPGTIKDANNTDQTNVCSGGYVSVNLSYANMGPGTYPVIWEKSTDGANWTEITDGVTPLVINGLTTTTYVRYIAKYTTECGVPSNNYYKLNVWEKPVVNDITAPADKCPNLSSYPLDADVTAGSSSTLTYHWGGDADATVTSNPGHIIPTTPNCNTSYNYSLYVTDGNNCQSNTLTVTNGFTTDNPAWNLGTIANVQATNSGTCEFKVPAVATLKAAVDAVLTSSCGNEVTLSNISPEPGTVITASQNVTATATDMCGNTHSVTIPVVVPNAPIVYIEPSSLSIDDYLLCPGETTTLKVYTTAEEPSYHWYPESLGTNQTATSIAFTGEEATVHSDYYYVVVTDKYGCTGNGSYYVYTTPKAYIADKEYTICADNGATMVLTSDDKKPEGSSTSGDHTFSYNTTYTWTIFSNTGVGGATTGTSQANFTTGTLTNTTLETQTVVYMVTPTTTTTTSVSGITLTNSCDGVPFTVTVNVKPKVTNDGAITNFDDADVIITLWYGACDTLYYVHTPSYNNNILPADLEINLTNDKAGTVNQGTTLLGRIAPGEYTIRWTFTDECGNSIFFDKKYIVRYPNCGEDDPNYTEPYRVTYDGYTYTTVRIGCECWLKENLRNQVDADGNNIAVAKVYQNDDSHLNPFGRLYTWYSAMGVTEDDNTAVPTTAQGRLGIYTPGICPEGWAIPKDAQFEDMMTYAHNNTREASSKNQAYWLPGAAGIDPNNGFEAVGAGYYDHYADFYYNLLAETHFWTSTPSSTTYKGKCVTFTHICPEMIKEEMMKGNAISVRCVKIEPND